MINIKQLVLLLSFVCFMSIPLQAQIKDVLSERRAIYFSESKIQKRANKRLIEKGTHIISILASNNQYPFILEDPNFILDNEASKGVFGISPKLVDAFYFNYEYALPKNFFIEAGYKKLYHWMNLKTVGNEKVDMVVDVEANSSLFSTHSFNLGGGYRIVGQNNLRYIDIHAGFSVGRTDNPVGSGGSTFSAKLPYEDFNGDKGLMDLSWKYKISSRYYYGFHLGVSKDIRVSKNLYLTARYHYQFGKNSEVSEHLIDYTIPTLNIKESVRGSNTAKGQMFALGLRWVFDK